MFPQHAEVLSLMFWVCLFVGFMYLKTSLKEIYSYIGSFHFFVSLHLSGGDFYWSWGGMVILRIIQNERLIES